jgi:hypothetical protein
VPTKKEDTPIILSTMYLDQLKEKNLPFYISFRKNGLHLNNCMLDSWAFTNVMSLKVRKQLGLKTTQPYGNVCGIDSRRVDILGVCEDVEVFLIDFPHMSVLMDILVISDSDSWGMILLRIWSSSLGGFLSMNLTHAYIPMGDGMYEILHNREKKDTHVMDLRAPNYVSEHYYHMPPKVIEYDPSKLPFMQEETINMFLPWKDKKKTAKLSMFHGNLHRRPS